MKDQVEVFMNEKEYIKKLYKKNFFKFKNKKIILYGISENTKTILNEFRNFNFLGLMDGFKNSGYLFGKPILDINNLALLKPDCIIIVARANSVKIITKRIKKICEDNKISLYDIQGNDLLLKNKETKKNNPYFSVTIEKLKQQILKYDVISFDIFDTLIMRKVLYPQDIFYIMESKIKKTGFAFRRIQAEKELYRNGNNPSLEDVYVNLAAKIHLSRKESKFLFEMEIQLEKAAIIIRKDMLDVFNFALYHKKKIYLISDMYLSKKMIVDMLDDLSIKGYKDIFVSSEYNTAKTQNLYEVFKKKIKSNNYLHIGDNPEADGVFAKYHEIDTFRIYSALDMFDISSYADVIKNIKTLDERILLGIFIANVFNSPFALSNLKGKPQISNAYDIGYLFAGPLLTAFMNWLLKKTQDEYDRVLFSARDGYIFIKMYQLVKKYYHNIKYLKAEYFYISRMASIAACLFTEDDIIYAARMGFAGTREELLRKRFFLTKKEIIPANKNESIEEYVLKHRTKILKHSAALRKNYNTYIKSLHIDRKEKMVFFDFVSSGTCQMCLGNLLENDISGMYFIHFLEDYKKKLALNVQAFIETGFLYELQSYLSQNYLLIESVIVSLEPTLKCFDEKGVPIYIEEGRSNSELTYIKEVQCGILDYFKDFLSIRNPINSDISPKFIDKMYSLVQNKYSVLNGCIFEKTISKDEFCNRNYVMNGMFL